VRRLAVIAVFAALVAGCGGESTVAPTAETVEGTPPPAPQPQAKGNAAAGKSVFMQSGCGGCHTFKPAGTSGTTGPDLDKLPEFAKKANMPLDEFVHESIVNPTAYVESGFPSGVMPAWSGNDKQLADLVAFLTKSA
jgi:mono/diheme cytochrome c family protein